MKKLDWKKYRKEDYERLWTEDDAAPDAEDVGTAWRRLFGTLYDDALKTRLNRYDGGDSFIDEYPGGILVHVCYDSDCIERRRSGVAAVSLEKIEEPRTLAGGNRS